MDKSQENNYHLDSSNIKNISLKTILGNKKMNPNLKISVFIVSFYFLIYWLPQDLLYFPNNRWYFALGVALFSFLLLRKPIEKISLNLFYLTFAFSFVGSILSLIRSVNIDVTLYNTVAFGISLVTYLLFIPVLSTQLARKVILIAMIIISFIWAIKIIELLSNYSFLAYSTFASTGADKNAIGFRLALAANIFFYLSLLGNIVRNSKKPIRFVLRFIFGFLGLLFLLFTTLIYARSALLSGIIGFLIIFYIFIIQSDNRTKVFKSVLILIILFSGLAWILPKIVAFSPYWNSIMDQLSTTGFQTFSTRLNLLDKGVFIISQNPFIGVGIGGTKNSISYFNLYFPDYYIHNTYVSEWAEKGLFGIMMYLNWIFLYINLIRKKLTIINHIDRIWLLILLLVFINLFFLDSNSLAYFMLVIFIGLYSKYFSTENNPRILTKINPKMVK